MLVKNGWCLWYRKYAPGDTVLGGLERKHETQRKACGPIRIPCRSGSVAEAQPLRQPRERLMPTSPYLLLINL